MKCYSNPKKLEKQGAGSFVAQPNVAQLCIRRHIKGKIEFLDLEVKTGGQAKMPIFLLQFYAILF